MTIAAGAKRFKLTIPARVTGHDRRIGKWHEMTETVEVSRTGVRLQLRKQIKPGTVLYLTFPLPSKLRSHEASPSRATTSTVC